MFVRTGISKKTNFTMGYKGQEVVQSHDGPLSEEIWYIEEATKHRKPCSLIQHIEKKENLCKQLAE